MTINENFFFKTLSSPEFTEKYRAIRHELHKQPETAFKEVQTASLIARHLESLGIDIHQGMAETAVIGTLRKGTSKRTIGLRADMDALDMDEENTFSHRSAVPGKMHGCGHDGHTTMLLAAAEILAGEVTFDGTVHFVFQPAEENEGGGRRMVEEGLFEKFPMDAIFGMHNIPGIALGNFAVKAGPIMAGYDVFDITIRGKGGHAAIPHNNTDPLVAAAAILTGLQTIMSRNTDPMKPSVVSVTQIHGGTTYNVSPEQAQLAGTVRYFDIQQQAVIKDRMALLVKQTAGAYGVEAEITYQDRYPPTINSPKESDRCGSVLANVFGPENVDLSPMPLMAAEDFSFMLQSVPGCYIWAGNGNGEGSCMVHNPRYDFNDDLIPYGATYWVELVEELLAKAYQ